MKKYMDQIFGVTSEHKFRYQLKTRKLVWVLAFVFASLLLAEYLELPYGCVISSLLSAAKHNFSSTSTRNVLDVASIAMSPEGEIASEVNDSTVDVRGMAMSPEGEMAYRENDSRVDVGGIAVSPEVKMTPQENLIVVENRTTNGESRVDPPISSCPNSTALGDNAGIAPSKNIIPNNETHHDSVPAQSSPSASHAPAAKQRPKRPMAAVVPISEMHNILLENRQLSSLPTSSWHSSADEELRHAKSEIENAKPSGDNQGLYPPVYRNISSFIRSYELMEQMLKVYIYKEGKKPVFHQPRLTGIYASEGWFLKLLESSKHFVTNKPDEAHLFYLPFTSQLLEEALYVRNSHSFDNLIQYLKDYLQLINTRYPFWNRTSGDDHFLVGCHDWAPFETKRVMANCIRALCNADLKEGFQLGKDVSLPETLVNSAKDPSKGIGGKPPSERNILAFYAGQMHGYVRPILLKHWQNKDPDMQIFGKMRGNEYSQHMISSKYCICPRGYEVNSPRVVEAIMHECIPVIISDNFVPPFFEILNWESFAVFVLEKDIPNLKEILLSISERRYTVMQYRVKKVRQHFLWHVSPEKYDIFHMILHSIWYNRVFQMNN